MSLAKALASIEQSRPHQEYHKMDGVSVVTSFVNKNTLKIGGKLPMEFMQVRRLYADYVYADCMYTDCMYADCMYTDCVLTVC